MVLSWVWLGMAAVSVVFGLLTGRIEAVSRGALEGAGAAVQLCIAMAGVLCLWSGIMEVMRRCGLAGGLARLLRGPLGLLFPGARGDGEAMEALSANVSANLLGLGNAATPLGLRAARRLHTLSGGGRSASNDLCMLVVLNTASLQLVPATVAGVRTAAGSAAPFDILPAVWVTSVCSVLVGVLAAKLLSRTWR
ncbi:MAG: spore maturation protein A [Oscillospiraceae bacterium]|jgi:spore maturation protein A|nr:spore maturation protein A [Oscillospiraceae bacterium]